jgi:hypothetical protein
VERSSQAHAQPHPGHRRIVFDDDAFWLDYCDRAEALCCPLDESVAA